MKTTRRFGTLVAVWCAWSAGVRAGELRLSRYFSDPLVLQREKPNVIRGFAAPRAAVTVSFGGQEKTVAAGADGAWAVALDPMPASATPRALAVKSGRETVALNDVLVGDVFLVALQTSVDLSLGATPEGRAAAAAHPNAARLRAISIRTAPAGAPQADLAPEATTGWTAINRESALRLSAAAYYLGRDLAAEADAPIGIVDLHLGPAFPVSWLSRESLLETEKFYGKTDVPGLVRRFDALLERKAKGEPLPPKESVTDDTLLTYAIFPAGGYNAVLHPLRGLALKAALVQLGNDYPHMIYSELERAGRQFDREELNRAYVQTYDFRKTGWRMAPVTTPRIPREWRAVFGDSALPFGLILPPGSDLATLAAHHREMRELHRRTAEENPGVGLILPGMENIPFSAQPADAALLAQRCLHWIRGAVLGRADAPATGPLFERLEPNFNEAVIRFKEGTARGLQAKAGALGFFEAAGVESEYRPVDAVIEGETIRVRSDALSRIAHVRYNWNDRPNAGLVNAAGLPALPFRSEKADYVWFHTHDDNDLPMEYSTPANEWPPSDVALISGHLKTHGYTNFSGWLGPIGVRTGPFGPNMGVREVKAGSPADGKLFVGDMIYSVNGMPVGAKAWEAMSAAITESETREMNGRLTLGVRRRGENLDVEITLPVMGRYSATAPYDCPKTEKIIANLEKWVVSRGADAGFLNTDALFLLATGNPELLGYVRRVVYKKMAGMKLTYPIDPSKAGKSWHNSADALLFGEYYLATGDRNVLPHLKYVCDRLAATMQPGGGWRHNYPGGPTYGLIPNAGLPGVMGMHFAKVAGMDIDFDAYRQAVYFYQHQQADTGFMIYGIGVQRPDPAPLDPDAMAAGKLSTYNGGLSAAGILMKLVGDTRAAHLCSLISAFAWNNTFDGHGGNFWNNFWTPLGAHAHGRPAFVHFWKNHLWYRELNRMYDGSLIQHENGDVGAGTGIALAAPRRRLQILGAPPSPFAADAPESLKPAIADYTARDYAACARRVDELLAGGTVGRVERPTVEALGRAAREMEASIAADLSRMEALARAGDPATAREFLAPLKGVMKADDARLLAVEKMIAESPQRTTARPAASSRMEVEAESAEDAASKAAAKEEAAERAAQAAKASREWVCLVTEALTGRSSAKTPGKVPEAQANRWRMKVVENLSQAPADWMTPDYDDSRWSETTLPISWRMYHTALFRTKFNVADKDAFDGLRFRGWVFRQQAMAIYLNGHLIGRVNNIEGKTGDMDGDFLDSAVRYLRNGENTLAVTTRHNWRWGMLSMHVYNDGFGFRLDARKKPAK